MSKKQYVIAVPGQIDQVNLRLNKAQVNIDLLFQWTGRLDEEKYKVQTEEKCIKTSSSPFRDIFPEFKSYNKHTQVKVASNFKVYHFVKYMDNTHNLNYVIYQNIIDPPSRIPPCPNYTHKPKLFSWNQVATMCKDMNGILPEFISRKDQEEFIRIIKYSTDLFPIEGVYIGLVHGMNKHVSNLDIYPKRGHVPKSIRFKRRWLLCGLKATTQQT